MTDQDTLLADIAKHVSLYPNGILPVELQDRLKEYMPDPDIQAARQIRCDYKGDYTPRTVSRILAGEFDNDTEHKAVLAAIKYGRQQAKGE